MQEDEDFSPDQAPDDDLPPDEGGDGPSAREKLLFACAAEPETDIGNGRRFRRRFGDLAAEHEGAASKIAICVANIGWHVFDGQRWKEDEDGALIRRLAHRTAEAIRKEAGVIEPTEDEQAVMAAGEVAEASLARMGDKGKRLPEIGDVARKRDYELAVEAAGRVAEQIGARIASRRRHAKSTAGSSKLNNMLVETQPYVAAKVQELNTNRLAVNCRSGTIEFIQVEDEESDPDDPRFHWKVRLREHRQADFITKMVEADWSPPETGEAGKADRPSRPMARPAGAAGGEAAGARREAKDPMPEFRRFLMKVQPDPLIRAFLKRFCGYLLTGLTIEQVMLFFFGAGRNGKSTFVDLLCHILGDYAVTLSIDSFSGENKRGGGEATPDLARLPGARLVAASEPEANVRLKDALIKTLTGGEKIPVRRLHKDFFEVEPYFKIILSGNHKPRIDDDSDGIWRRVLLVPWTVQIPSAEVDRALSGKLRAEADGVFAWMVEGAIEYLNGGLDVPQSVHAASEEYRQESDPIGTFIRMACIVTGEPSDEEKPFDLYIAYDKFAGQEGIFKYNSATFAKRFASAAGRSWPGPDGTVKTFAKAKSGTTVYRGIKVKAEWIPSSHDRQRAEQGDER
ncbi:phage/plasmid primase, P4 family [Mesorhizobium sp. GbtcB19]|uniref:DNA primase family protein n=1 Tax=Mesorhizobium sp. GbtcB19 TaxID=2824764 RepID=UPI001C310F27|nr:phage/plasmid primase, P4 family [Mesorhizobium sp. GbtcB19]